MGRFLCEMTYEECRDTINENTIIVIPSGGGTKEHGYHLPMGTDMYVTEYVSGEVTKRCDVITLPIVSYAYYPAFIGWKGSVSLQYDTSIKLMEDIITCYARFGVKKFLIIDGGVSTQAPMKILSSEMYNRLGVRVAVTDIVGLGAEAEKQVCEQKAGGHGDESETSCMLCLHPQLVHMEKAVEEYREVIPGMRKDGIVKISMGSQMETPHGINGNSTLATAAKGKVILNAMVDGIVEFVEEYKKLKGGKDDGKPQGNAGSAV